MYRKTTKILLLFTLLVTGVIGGIGSSGGRANAASVSFSDIKGHWAEQNIINATKAGLVNGFPDGTFRPDDVVTGDQFVTMMLKAFSDGGTKFDQTWLESLTFKFPTQLSNIRSAVSSSGFKFQNAKSGYWAKTFLDMLYEMQYMTSFDPVFPQTSGYDAFKKQITREKASYLLGKWLDTYEESYDDNYISFVESHSGLTDMKDFTNGPVSMYRATVLISGVINGWNNHFYPKRYVTRAEALTMAQRLRDMTLRSPLKPNLNGQLYAEVDGNIYIYSDKFKLDTYKSIIALAKSNVTSGYVATGKLGVAVFDSKDTFDRNDYLIRIGDLENAPPAELSLTVGSGNGRIVELNYLASKKMPNSTKLFDAAFELLGGTGQGAALKTKVTSLEKGLTSSGVSFKFNNKSFKMYKVDTKIIVDLLY